MGAPRRFVASLLATALLVAGPLGVPKSCTDCPPGCPMHAEDGTSGRAKGQPGCHRVAQPAPEPRVCLRSVCGHDAISETGLTLLALPTRAAATSSPTPGPRIATPSLRVASLDAPEPRLRPPRPARG